MRKLRVVQATREHEAVTLGASPRAAMAWIHAARARAVLYGRDYVLPDDLKALAKPVLEHRLVGADGGEAGDVLAAILAREPIDL